MGDLGEPEADHSSVPSPSVTHGHLEREKLVKLEGQPGGEGRDCVGRVHLGTGGGHSAAWKLLDRGLWPWLLLNSGNPGPGHSRTHSTTYLMPAGVRQVGPSDPHAP